MFLHQESFKTFTQKKRKHEFFICFCTVVFYTFLEVKIKNSSKKLSLIYIIEIGGKFEGQQKFLTPHIKAPRYY